MDVSLLHDALKKAEKEGTLRDSGAMVDVEESKSSLPRIRLIILVTLTIFSLLFVVVARFYKRAQMGTAPVAKAFSTPLEIAGGPSVDKIAEEALSLTRTGNYEEARKRWEKVVILEPRNAEAYNNLGFVLKKLDQKEAAFEQYRKSLSLDPQCAECLNNLGILYLANRDLAEAESHLQKAIQIRPDYADPYFNLALLMEARGDFAGAKERYQKYMELARDIGADLLLKIQKRVADLQAR